MRLEVLNPIPYRNALAFGYRLGESGNSLRESYVLLHPYPWETRRSLKRWVEAWLVGAAEKLLALPLDDPTEILRPNAAGDASLHTANGAATEWECVDEATSDGDTTYVSQIDTAEVVSYYNLQATALTTETVDSVDCQHRSRGDGTTGGRSRGGVRLSSVDTAGALRSPADAYTLFEDAALARPGGGSWAVGDLNALQVYMGLRIQIAAGSSETRCTQIYVEINYTAALPPGLGPVEGELIERRSSMSSVLARF